MLVYGTWYDGTTRFDLQYGKNMVHDMVYVGGMVYGKKHRMWYGMLAVWYGENTVCGMVRWYGVVGILYG